MPLIIKRHEAISDSQIQDRALIEPVEQWFNGAQIISVEEGYYVKIWIGGHMFYVTPERPRKSPRYWRRLPSLIEHFREAHPYIKKLGIVFEAEPKPRPYKTKVPKAPSDQKEEQKAPVKKVKEKKN